MFLPTTKKEIEKLGWDQPDIILVSGDVYIDSPYDGTAVIGRVLHDAGYKVAIIAQPDISSGKDITRLGEPSLFWGVSGGLVDSMVANYTALKKKKKSDDMTPGGVNTKRPDRAVIKYSNLIRQHFKSTPPIVLGGIEASLRRIAHYDFWSNKVRRSVLFDSKADVLIYGMGEKPVLELADNLRFGNDYRQIRGLCYISDSPKKGYTELPSFEVVSKDKKKFTEMFHEFYKNNDPLNADGLYQKHGDKYLVQNPPAFYPDPKELDKIHELEYEYDVHPYYAKMGKIKSLDTIKFSINTHRGCFGECNFCAITVHQGRKIRNRSVESIVREAEKLTKLKGFKGYIYDLGGPTANMYGMNCKLQDKKGSCKDKRCLFPEKCKAMNISHKPVTDLYRKIREIPGIKKVFIGSGIRYDLVVADDKHGNKYLEDVIEHHVSGQMKIAPEHSDDRILKTMGKPDENSLIGFRKKFNRITNKLGMKQFLTYYFIAAHPGCEDSHMIQLKEFVRKDLKLNPEQVQVFTPTPSTYSTLMYYTGKDPFTGKKLYVEKDNQRKERQKMIITGR